MRDEEDWTAATPMMVWSHPATLEAGDRFPPAYPVSRPAAAPPGATDPAFAPWMPQLRFAPPGPSNAFLSAPVMFMPLAEPVLRLAQRLPIQDLPVAALDEPAVLERIAEVSVPPGLPEDDGAGELREDGTAAPVTEAPTLPYWAEATQAPPAEAVRYSEPDAARTVEGRTDPPQDTVEDEAEAAAPPHTAYWASAASADSLQWDPPAIAEDGETRRATPAMAGLWAAEPVEAADDFGPLPTSRPERRSLPRIAMVAAGGVALAAACIATVLVLPRLLSPSSIPAATFNAPMMVLRAAVVGRVAAVAVKNGQTIEPSTVLLTIHTDPLPDPATSLLQDRLESARGRLAALDDALTQPTPNTDAGRARLADLRRQRAAAATDVAQFQDGLANLPPKPPTDQPVRAGVHGVIRSLEAQAGTPTAAGVPLVRMLDCDHAFLTLAPSAKLQAGQTVQVRLPNLPPVAATVRKSSGIAEPPDSLVIAPAPGAFVSILSGSCPVGATATVTPSTTGS